MAQEADGWTKVDRCVDDARKKLEQAATEEQFQTIGLICREMLISLAQIVYIPTRHPSLDGVLPSETDAKRMLEAYLTVELAGGPNQAARKHAKAALDLANDLQHRRTASYRDAAMCTDATVAVVGLIALISGRATRATIPNIEVEFAYLRVQYNHDEHTYQLKITVTNTGKQAINNFKLEFEFPDLDSAPRKWISPSRQRKPSGPLVEVMPKDEVSFSKDNFMVRVSYRSKNILFPQEKLDLSESIGMKYRINGDIYDNIEEMPLIRWTLYADNMSPKQGELSLTQLNNY